MSLYPALYIHIPFCKSHCAYCDFYSLRSANPAQLKTGFVRALLAEMRLRASEVSPLRENDQAKPRLYSLYFGGGTPSMLDHDEWSDIFEGIHECFLLPPDAEITAELNPDDVTPTLARHLLSLGVNRVSLGVQSLDDAMLTLLRRRHDAGQAVEAVHTLREAGFLNISTDLIYGLPFQTASAFRRDLDAMLRLPITHLSAYALSVEPGTLMQRQVESGVWQVADDETALAMYTQLMERTAAAGWEHYEISNFALPGYRSRHNSAYWQQRPYIGLGPAAASYDGQRRRRVNYANLQAYTRAATSGIDVPHDTEQLTDENLYNEIIMTRLRTREGLPLQLLPHKEQKYLLHVAAPHIRRGLLMYEGDHLRLSRQALFVSDDILSDLMRC